METKITIKSVFGKILFEHEGENNTIRETLEHAILVGANLGGADLRGADLRGANLGGADLPMFCKWGHSIKNNILNIGCESKTIEEWKQWLKSNEEFETKRGTQEFKQIEAVIRAYIAYYEVLN